MCTAGSTRAENRHLQGLIHYPIDKLLPDLCRQVLPGKTLLLQAPPGAGKTTRVPLALIGALPEASDPPLRTGEIWMVEPRRLATKAAAARLADTLNERPGQRIGYCIRGERKRSNQTMVDVITDGVFLRRLQSDPSLKNVACILFDEFHERRRDADLGLTLLREAAPVLRPDLSIVLMSATLDVSDLRRRLPEATVLESEGRSFPVETIHQAPRSEESLAKQVLRAFESHALNLRKGSGVLVFLPGLREIERCRHLLRDAETLKRWRVVSLHGELPLREQSAALQRCSSDHDGTVILASSIAESSVTIDSVRLVIDSGRSRQLRFDPNTGMEGLETVPSSLASADQRRGRAGRQAPGRCIRLWSPAEQQRRPPFSPPELLLADPKPVVMELAQWGAGLCDKLPWLDPPPKAAMNEAQRELASMGLLTTEGRQTSIGKQLNGLGVHPRLGLLMLEARRRGCPQLGCDLAAVLSERDPLAGRAVSCDLQTRLDVLQQHRSLLELSRQLRRQLDRVLPPPPEDLQNDGASAAELIAAVFPSWVAQERPGHPGHYRLRQGRGAVLPDHDSLIGTPALAVARVDTGGVNTRIQLALPMDSGMLRAIAEREGRWSDSVSWDASLGQIRSERQLLLGELVIERSPQNAPDAGRCRTLMVQQLKESETLDVLPWTDSTRQLRQRLQWMHLRFGHPWPDRTISSLRRNADDWIGAALEGCRSWRELTSELLEQALWGDLNGGQRQELERLLPRQISVPSGRKATIHYNEEDAVLSVKLQEMFGCTKGPCVLQGALPITLELLSPAGRTLQRTRDLSGFWEGSYGEIRREMRGRYPKHPWPENPLQAVATSLSKRNIRRDPSPKH